MDWQLHLVRMSQSAPKQKHMQACVCVFANAQAIIPVLDFAWIDISAEDFCRAQLMLIVS